MYQVRKTLEHNFNFEAVLLTDDEQHNYIIAMCWGKGERFYTCKMSAALQMWVSTGCAEARIRSGRRALAELHNAICSNWNPTLP